MIDRTAMPKTGNAFVVALHGPLFLRLSGIRAAVGDFPKLALAAFSPVGGVSPYLITLWTFDDPEANGRVVGGIEGPTERPDRDWREFRAALDEVGKLDANGYGRLLDDLDRVVRTYVLSRPDLFKPLH